MMLLFMRRMNQMMMAAMMSVENRSGRISTIQDRDEPAM